MENIKWEYKQFSALTSAELYNILTLRNEVFVVEQNCIYLDTDNKDQHAWHLLGYINEKLVAYSRILPPGVSFHEASIGRVVTHSSIRRNGIGNELMKESIEKTIKQFEVNDIRIGAQCYLIKFYTSLGFAVAGNEYMEDGIPHVEMLFKIKK